MKMSSVSKLYNGFIFLKCLFNLITNEYVSDGYFHMIQLHLFY